MASKNQPIAHHRESDGAIQTLETHLHGVADLSKSFANKIGLADHGELLGLLHDFGKYSQQFQNYLKSAVDLLNPDEDEEFVDAKGLKGKVDHSSAGAQLVWRELSKQGQLGQIVGQILALCIASHHSGLIDCLTSALNHSVEDAFSKRMNKLDSHTHLSEALERADESILSRYRELVSHPDTTRLLHNAIAGIARRDYEAGEVVIRHKVGLLVRFLFSCLIDADRLDTADFENPRQAKLRMRGGYTGWNTLIARLEEHLGTLEPKRPIDLLRRDISNHCLDGASRAKGIFTLTVPTGGGKTLASLRFALHHAKKHGMDRIINIIPFTSIIDQNTDVVRSILEPGGVESGSIVLEHHSNLTPEEQTWRDKILSENWDAPVIYTTSVQILETLFGAGTRGARRMHQLANAVLIFDEIQTLPVKCVHLFNNAVNFLVDHCGATVVLCTATQPLLDQVCKKKGALKISEKGELMPDVRRLFADLRRVEVKHQPKPGGWRMEEIAAKAQEETQRAGSCLVIVNTKRSAQTLYRLCATDASFPVFHLSTHMCPAHRKSVLAGVRRRLERHEPTLCVSTQLIEAGVDVDFGAVIRFTAGLDSIAQAAGRCNRHGQRDTGLVQVVNPDPDDEKLGMLPDIEIGRDKAKRVLDDYEADPERFGCNLIGPEAIGWYYQNYFFARAKDMEYPIGVETLGREDTLLNLLSTNCQAVAEYKKTNNQAPLYLRQSFMAASKAFKTIDAPTRGIIVPYGQTGREVVAALCAAYLPDKEFDLLRRAQQFTVNVLPQTLDLLGRGGAIREIQEGSSILFLADSRYYSDEFGLGETPDGIMEVLSV